MGTAESEQGNRNSCCPGLAAEGPVLLPGQEAWRGLGQGPRWGRCGGGEWGENSSGRYLGSTSCVPGSVSSLPSPCPSTDAEAQRGGVSCPGPRG